MLARFKEASSWASAASVVAGLASQAPAELAPYLWALSAVMAALGFFIPERSLPRTSTTEA